MPHAEVLGCRVDGLSLGEAVNAIVALAHGTRPSLVVTLGTEMVMQAQRDPAFRAIVNSSALALCDTAGVQWAARRRGLDVPARVTGIDLLEPLAATLAEEKVPIYFLGGKGDTAAQAAQALAARHPGLIVAGARDGFFSDEQDRSVAAAIAASGARVLFAGLGSPRQERWLAANLPATGALVGVGVGGSFDVLAGNVRRAPRLLRRLNLEWLYRLVTEPRRWRRQLVLPVFAWRVLRGPSTTRANARSAQDDTR